MGIAQEKVGGMLKSLDVFIAETGMPGVSPESKFQRLGYNRIIKAVDKTLLPLEAQGIKGHEIFSSVGVFTGGNFPEVDTKFPLRLDFEPWTLLRKGESGAWNVTPAAQRLPELIATRLFPPTSSVVA